MINEIGKAFMSNGVEYKVAYVDEKKQRITVEPIEGKDLPHLNESIIIENEPYIVTYINEGKRRVSLTNLKRSII